MTIQDPDMIISIGGSHPAKGILAVVIANALKEASVKNISHLNYDSDTFEQMTLAVNESNESNLSTANVLIVEFEEDHIDSAYDTSSADEKTDEVEQSSDAD